MYKVKVLWNSGKEQVKQFNSLEAARSYAERIINPVNACLITKVK